jgi:hypothetical protein
MKLNFTIPALACALTFTAPAEVPNLIHHQGILQDKEGVPVNGPAEFKFAFVNPDGSASFWSNDGTSVAGSAPAAFVALPVSNGLFNVQLGDPNLGMQPLTPEVFASPQVFLRVWINGEQLVPDRQVTTVGYAMQAATVAAGAINPASIPSNTIQSHHIVNQSVQSEDLAPAITLNSLNLEKAGALRSELSSDLGGRLRLWDGLDKMTAFLGSSGGGGDLNLFQINGKPGIMLNGDAATYDNAGSAGGEITVHSGGGLEGVMIDGEHDGGGRISVSKHGSFPPSLDLFGKGLFDGGEIRVLANKGVKGVEILGQGKAGGIDPKRTADGNQDGAGRINLYQPGGLGAVLYGSATEGGGAISLRNKAGDSKFLLYGGPDAASMKMANAAGQVTVEIQASDADGNGLVRTQVLEITGGSDLSEKFNINSDGLAPEPGMLVSIDPANPGELVLSTTPYDRTAAGVISGAGGVNPGMLMGQTGSIANGDHPVALTGRVYCHVDASFGAIEPGDLITTSATPGHGMKVGDHGQAQGAIVGKAMTGLKEGRGLVLVLVSLQ